MYGAEFSCLLLVLLQANHLSPIQARRPNHKVSPLGCDPHTLALGLRPSLEQRAGPRAGSLCTVCYLPKCWCQLSAQHAPSKASSSGLGGGSWAVASLVLFRVQLVESLYDHAVDFLKIIDVLSFSCESS